MAANRHLILPANSRRGLSHNMRLQKLRLEQENPSSVAKVKIGIDLRKADCRWRDTTDAKTG